MFKRPERRRSRQKVRRRIRGTVRGSAERPRLAIFRSSRHIYVQAIDDDSGQTIASASTVDKDCRTRIEQSGTGSVNAAKVVGGAIAERLRGQGVEKAVFDRGGFLYHGRIRAIADAAREGGLKF